MSNKKKNIVVSILFVACMILCIAIPFRNTYSLSEENAELVDKLKNTSDFAAVYARKRSELEQLNLLVGHSLENRNLVNLLESAGSICQQFNAKLINLSEPVVDKKNGYAIETYTVLVEGPYASLLQCIDALENSKNASHVCSASFTLNIDQRTKRKYLTCLIYVQKILTTEL